MSTTLGLDLGPNSIGWALLDPESSRIIRSGVRVFPEGVDKFDTTKEESRNEQRRLARQMRRQHHRRSFRKTQLRAALAEAGLLPVDPAAQRSLLESDPYPLRARALTEKLKPHELGRILYHLNQRRGFLSLRKKERKDNTVKGLLAEIDRNEAARVESGAETVGAWLATKQKVDRADHTHRTEDDHLRNRHLSRKQIEDEFNLIWDRQREFGHDVLTDQLRYGDTGRRQYPVKPEPLDGKTALQAFGLHGLMFFQRPITWPASAVGRCELEPRHRRCARADRHAQRFRMLQEVNNLRYIDPDDGGEKRLTDEQRQLLLGKLARSKEMTFDKIREALGFLKTVKFNLERGERGKIKGHVTDAVLAGKKHVGPAWHKLDERDKDRIVRNLLDTNMSDEQVERRLVERYGLTAEQAEGAVIADLPAGHVDYSLKAIDKLLPELERGLVVMARDKADSALHAAGYLRPDEHVAATFEQLPALTDGDCPIPEIANPVVRRALVELRKVVNAIIREFGKPDAIHLEMAREVQQGKKRRDEYNKRNRQREAERDKAADEIRKLGEKVTRDKIIRYMLWEEQGRVCPYTGDAIAQTQIFGGQTDVDHILPRSQSLDNAQMNKVLVFREANREKGQRTVHGWLANSHPERYQQVIQRARRLPYPKFKRFRQKEADLGEFIARQLTDTAYIARLTGQYLRCLYDAPDRVLGLKGQLTSELRHHWGLETVLSEMQDSPAWAADAELRPGEKNRADHRHHTIDAIVIALSDRSRLQQLARIHRQGGVRSTGEVLPDPWDGFRRDVINAVADIKVSHRANRKISGGLHEDTLYGPTQTRRVWVIRKPLLELSANEIDRIRDEGIRRVVKARLAEHGIEVGRGKKPDQKKMAEALKDAAMPSGVPIRKVRVEKPEKTIRRIRPDSPNPAYVRPGNTHHLCVFEWTEKRKAVFVPMIDAIERVRRHEPLIQRKPPTDGRDIPPDARFLFSLSQGELVLADVKGQETLLVFKTAASTSGRLRFAEHTDARRSGDQRKHVFKANTLRARKVSVDPLGRVRWAKD